jgi:hypothetical protein
VLPRAGTHGRNRCANRTVGIALGLLKPRHANQDESNFLGIEDSAYLLQTRHPQTVRFIDHDEAGRSLNLPLLFSVLSCDLTIGRSKLWNSFRQPVVCTKYLLGVLLVTSLNGFQLLFPVHSQRSFGQVLERVACLPDVGGDVAWGINNARSVENRIEQGILCRT